MVATGGPHTQNATIFIWLEELRNSGATPNNEIRGDGSAATSHILENVSKMGFQKLHSLVHDQNMCTSVAGSLLTPEHMHPNLR